MAFPMHSLDQKCSLVVFLIRKRFLVEKFFADSKKNTYIEVKPNAFFAQNLKQYLNRFVLIIIGIARYHFLSI